ncbi:MAG: LysR family transcriptional regulator [Pseudomonadota bacterium]
MNIESMRAFLEITATGSFQQAAERLHITQSAISARIKGLEQHLNRELFRRKRAGIELTDAGSRFFRHAQICVQSWERAQQEIALPAEIDNQFSLGLQINLWQRLVLPWSTWMDKNAPQIATRIVADYSEKLISQVRDGILDMAVVYAARPNASLIIETFDLQELILVSTTPRSTNIGWTPGYVFVDWSEGFQDEHSNAFPESPLPRLSVGSSSIALAHILRHGGSAYLSGNDVDKHLAEKKLFRVENAPTFKRSSYLVYLRENNIQPSIDISSQGLRACL